MSDPFGHQEFSSEVQSQSSSSSELSQAEVVKLLLANKWHFNLVPDSQIGEAEGIVPVPSDECASVQFGEGEEVVASGETGLFPAHQLTVRENGACVSYPEAVDGSALVDCNGYGARLRNGESVKNYGEIRTTHQEVDRHRRTCVESVRKIFALPQTTGTEPVLEGEPQLLGANGKLVKLSDLGAVEYVKCDESPGIQQTVADNPKSWSTYSVSLNAEAKTVVVPTGDPAIPSGASGGSELRIVQLSNSSQKQATLFSVKVGGGTGAEVSSAMKASQDGHMGVNSVVGELMKAETKALTNGIEVFEKPNRFLFDTLKRWKIQAPAKQSETLEVSNGLSCRSNKLSEGLHQKTPAQNVQPVRNEVETGKQALCTNCGTWSNNLGKCDYCKKPLPPDAKMLDVEGQALLPSSPSIAGRKPNSAVRKPGGGKVTRKQEECITLSSDDEDQPKPKKIKKETECEQDTEPKNTDSSPPSRVIFVNSSASGGQEVSLSSPLPSSTNSDSSDELIQKIKDSMKDTTSVVLECMSIRIGDYKCTPNQSGNKLLAHFTKQGILFTVPHAQKQSQLVPCAVPVDKVLQVLAGYHRSLNGIFLTTGPACASEIRKRLGLGGDSKQVGLYYDPVNGDKYQKRLVLLPVAVNEEQQASISNIFRLTIQEIDRATVNSILVSLTRQDPNAAEKTTRTRSGGPPQSQASSSSGVSTNAKTDCPPAGLPRVGKACDQMLLSYNNMGIHQQDILCLADEQFLNDSILDFWLKYTELEKLTSDDRERTYMFSTFFYKRLTTKPKKRLPNSIEDNPIFSASDKRHHRVKRWTKNVDIFAKDFLIVPINESLHWFLAVICFPGLEGPCNMETGEPLHNYSNSMKKKKTTKSDSDESEPSVSSEADKQGTEETQGNDESIDSDKQPSVRVRQPCIMIFDSLGGDSRARVYSTLREYLRIEYKTRKGVEREFTKTNMPGLMPKVPQQPNSFDCGIYTLFFVECFFKYPILSYDGQWGRMVMDWFKNIEECDLKRSEIYNTVRELIKKSNPLNVQFVPNLTFAVPPVRKPDINSSSSSSISAVEPCESVANSSDHDHDYAGPPMP